MNSRFKKTFRADDGLEIVGEVRGQGDTALVFLHGWGGDREYWKNHGRRRIGTDNCGSTCFFVCVEIDFSDGILRRHGPRPH